MLQAVLKSKDAVGYSSSVRSVEFNSDSKSVFIIMYQKNLKNYYNRYYGRGKAAALNHSLTKIMLEDSEDEYIPEKLDRDSLAKEQKFASVMFLVTIAILLVKLFELASE